jgi:hypothetical protein
MNKLARSKFSASLIVLSLSMIPTSPAFAAAKAGAKCTKIGGKETVKGVQFTCIKSGTKIIWDNGKKTATTKENINQANARKAAASYLAYSAFSRTGLIKQLEYEGFSNADATYGADAQNANWNTQAAKAAKSYLSYSAFSRSGLIEQLMYEGYTLEQATFGVDSTGLK